MEASRSYRNYFISGKCKKVLQVKARLACTISTSLSSRHGYRRKKKSVFGGGPETRLELALGYVYAGWGRGWIREKTKTRGRGGGV